MSYCPNCNKDQITFEQLKLKNTKTDNSSDSGVTVHCSICKFLIKFPNAINRIQFLQLTEENTYKKYAYYPLLVLFILFLGAPLLSLIVKWTTGLSYFVGGLFALIGVPIIVTKLTLNALPERFKRLIVYTTSVSKSFVIGIAIGAFVGMITYHVLLDVHVSSIVSTILGYVVGVLICVRIVYLDFLGLRILFSVLDDELYAKINHAYEEVQNDSFGKYNYHEYESDSHIREEVDNNLIACYEVFDLTPNATYDEVRSEYKKMIKKFHPDKVEHLKNKFPDEYDRAVEISKKINAAHDYIYKYNETKNSQENIKN